MMRNLSTRETIVRQVNRFIDSLVSRGDKKLIAFFKDLAENINDYLNYSETIQSERDLMEYQTDKLRHENEILKKTIDLFIPHYMVSDLTIEELEMLNKLRRDNYYSIITFNDDRTFLENYKILQGFFPSIGFTENDREDLKNEVAIYTKELGL